MNWVSQRIGHSIRLEYSVMMSSRPRSRRGRSTISCRAFDSPGKEAFVGLGYPRRTRLLVVDRGGVARYGPDDLERDQADLRSLGCRRFRRASICAPFQRAAIVLARGGSDADAEAGLPASRWQAP